MFDIDFDKSKNQMDSPRSLEACRQLGIIPDELYYQDFETYIRLNPEVIGLPKEIQRIRFENIDKYRKTTIQMIKEQRTRIIDSEKDKKNNDTINANNNFVSNNNNEIMNNNTMDEERQIYNLDEQFDNMIDKERKNIEKLKRRQKNEIEAEIEAKIIFFFISFPLFKVPNAFLITLFFRVNLFHSAPLIFFFWS